MLRQPAADAQAIGAHVWGRYHRTLNPAVLAVLIEKPLPDATPACGNPLWLTLALEQLNLLDADDFARAERDFTGSPTERLAALLLDTARRMPPDIEGLYGWLLEQNEKAFGLAETRAFATAIALSRSGWRESDLLDLVPRLSPHFKNQNSTAERSETDCRRQPAGRGRRASSIITHQSSSSLFDPLALATLRRSFRAHLVRRGEHEQLDFFHAQMRCAVLARCVPDEETPRAIHAAISDYLETLPASDPLIRFERMRQLIGERNATRVGAYYATIKADAGDELSAERLGSTWSLVDWLAEGEDDQSGNQNLAWVCSWLAAPSLSNDQIYSLTKNFQFGLFELMENDISLPTRQRLIEVTRDAITSLLDLNPENADWRRGLSATYFKLGRVLESRGDLSRAQIALQEDMAITASLTTSDPDSYSKKRDLCISLNEMGDLLVHKGDLTGAIKVYEESLNMAARMADTTSNVNWKNLQGVSLGGIGGIRLMQGDLAGAIKAYRESMIIATQVAATEPTNSEWQRCLAISHGRLGDVLLAKSDLDETVESYNLCNCIFSKLAENDPSNTKILRDLVASYERIGVVLLAKGELSGSLTAFKKCRDTMKSIAQNDLSNAKWQRDLGASHGRIGEVLYEQGDLDGAREAYLQALEIHRCLAAAAPTNAGWQRDLVVSYVKMAQMAEQNSTGDARDWWRKAYAQLSGMKQRGIMLPTDEGRLEFIRQKVEESPENQEFASAERPPPKPPPKPPSNPALAALALLKASRVPEALEALRPIIFPTEAIAMDHRTPLEARLAFVHALWLSENVEGVLRHLSSLPEQTDPRVQALSRRVADWQQGLSRMQKLGFKKKPPLPAPPPLDDIT